MEHTDFFRYLDFHVQTDSRTVHFNYELSHAGTIHKLTEILVFPISLSDLPTTSRSLRALHIALGISYYKTFLPPTIEQPYAMEKAEVDFWNDVFQNGLGEFLYVNKLSKDHVAKFHEQTGTAFNEASSPELNNTAILGIGGGKDSIVAGEILKKIGVDVSGFVMATGEQLGQSQSVAHVMQIPLHAVGRTLAPELLSLQNESGSYSGHVPISLIFGLVGVTLALSQQSSFVIVANEASASIPTTEWEGEAVNHQWSKSFSFEQSLQTYIKQNIATGVTYFSAIRPLSSVAVAKKFSQYPEYFEVFTSDNFVFRIDPARRPNGRWSLESPKSLSSFILLSPWLSEQDMLRTFSTNFLDQPSLEQLFKELVGLSGHPPLDCVGTVDELVLSLNLASKQDKFQDTFLMKLAHTSGIIHDAAWEVELANMLRMQPDASFPDELNSKLKTELAA